MDRCVKLVKNLKNIFAICCMLNSMLILTSCSKGVLAASDNERISFLKRYDIAVNTARPYYNSQVVIPKTFNTIWKMRSIFSEDLLDIKLDRFKGKNCNIYMYPVSKLAFDVRKDDPVETRAVIISYDDHIICSYIDFILEIRVVAPMSLNGKTISELSQISWDVWKAKMDSDDNKRVVIWEYYDSLKSGNYEEAYSYIYDKKNISKEYFIDTASKLNLSYIDFLSLEQTNEPSDHECSFTVKANIKDGKKTKTCEIVFNLKKDSSSKEYDGWKIYSVKEK